MGVKICYSSSIWDESVLSQWLKLKFSEFEQQSSSQAPLWKRALVVPSGAVTPPPPPDLHTGLGLFIQKFSITQNLSILTLRICHLSESQGPAIVKKIRSNWFGEDVETGFPIGWVTPLTVAKIVWFTAGLKRIQLQKTFNSINLSKTLSSVSEK